MYLRGVRVYHHCKQREKRQMKVILVQIVAILLCFFWYDLWSLLVCRGRATVSNPVSKDL